METRRSEFHIRFRQGSGSIDQRKEELKPEDETIYYQRMAFCFHIRSMSRMMNGEEVHLCIGGVRSLNEENLYARKSPEKFKIFIGWRVRVCSNLMLTNDGLTGRLEVMSDADIYSSALRLFQDFNPEQNLRLLETWEEQRFHRNSSVR